VEEDVFSTFCSHSFDEF